MRRILRNLLARISRRRAFPVGTRVRIVGGNYCGNWAEAGQGRGVVVEQPANRLADGRVYVACEKPDGTYVQTLGFLAHQIEAAS